MKDKNLRRMGASLVLKADAKFRTFITGMDEWKLWLAFLLLVGVEIVLNFTFIDHAMFILDEMILGRMAWIITEELCKDEIDELDNSALSVEEPLLLDDPSTTTSE